MEKTLERTRTGLPAFWRMWTKPQKERQPTLRQLRRAISKAWTGPDAVTDIRLQRTKQ